MLSSKIAVITGSYVMMTVQILAVSIAAAEIAELALWATAAMSDAEEAPPCCWCSGAEDPFSRFPCDGTRVLSS